MPSEFMRQYMQMQVNMPHVSYAALMRFILHYIHAHRVGDTAHAVEARKLRAAVREYYADAGWWRSSAVWPDYDNLLVYMKNRLKLITIIISSGILSYALTVEGWITVEGQHANAASPLALRCAGDAACLAEAAERMEGASDEPIKHAIE